MRYFLSESGAGTEKRLEDRGVSRRQFLKFCAVVAGAMGLDPAAARDIAAALASPGRPPVVWLAMSECTGCAEALLRATDPPIADVLFDVISLDYHETIMQASGHAADEALMQSVEKNKGKFICVVDGSIPTVDNGAWGMVGGVTMLKIAQDVCPQAAFVMSVGTCSSYGGIPAAKPNPSGAKALKDAVPGINPVCVPGCPPNPVNIVGTIVHLATKGMPKLDANNRPVMFFGDTVHDKCPRLKHFEASEFAKSFDSAEAKKGWCLYELGCKGPFTYNNCPTALFNRTSWPVQAGHPCIGCSEPDFWDAMSPFYETTG